MRFEVEGRAEPKAIVPNSLHRGIMDCHYRISLLRDEPLLR